MPPCTKEKAPFYDRLLCPASVSHLWMRKVLGWYALRAHFALSPVVRARLLPPKAPVASIQAGHRVDPISGPKRAPPLIRVREVTPLRPCGAARRAGTVPPREGRALVHDV